MARAGRPNKLTPEVNAEIAAELAVAIPKTIAFEARGMERHALDRWLKNRQFHAIYEEKRRQVLEGWLRRLEAAPWQATAWLLERVYKEDFAHAGCFLFTATSLESSSHHYQRAALIHRDRTEQRHDSGYTQVGSCVAAS